MFSVGQSVELIGCFMSRMHRCTHCVSQTCNIPKGKKIGKVIGFRNGASIVKFQQKIFENCSTSFACENKFLTPVTTKMDKHIEAMNV